MIDREKERMVTIVMDKEFHRVLKLRAYSLGTTMKDYILTLIKNDVESAKKDA